MSEVHREIGIHEKAIETLEREMKEVKQSLIRIEMTLAETKGGVRTLIAVGSVAGAIGAGIVKVLAFIKGA